jgi:hypothetical protein
LKRIGEAAARFSLAVVLTCAATLAAAETATAPAIGEPEPALRPEPVIRSSEAEEARAAPSSESAAQPAATSSTSRATRAGATSRERLPAIDPATEQLTATIAGLREDLARLQAERERSDAANQRLAELNGQLRQEVESLALELQAARANARQRWLLYGAGLLLLGVLTGVLVKARPRRSAWS